MAAMALSLLPPRSRADDWPTFMHDNGRTGVTAESLRPPLAPRWVFTPSFPPAAGWSLPVNGYGALKNKPNVSFDDAPRVVAAGDTCFFCSSGEHAVYAVDAATGRIKWRHLTGGAPRLAPVCREGRVIVSADDGVVRCLDAGDGRQLWTVNVAPADDLMLGHGRFSSVWPIRAGGIVEDGTVYLTAGLFPYNRLYFYAIDTRDGTVRWCRQLDEGGHCKNVPQGHILIAGDTLFTTSRTTPARWTRDGRPMDFNTPLPRVKDSHEYRFYNGGSYAQALDDKYIVYGRACLLAYDPDGELKDKYGRVKKGTLLFNWFNARQAVFRESMAYLSTDTHLLAIRKDILPDIAARECREFEEAYKFLRIAHRLELMERYERLVRESGEEAPQTRALRNGPLRWSRERWNKWPEASRAIIEKIRRRTAWMTALRVTEALILAGDVLYAGGEDLVCAVDAVTGEQLWSADTGSRVRGLAVASGRLYVSTIDGCVRCFAKGSGAGEPAQVSPVTDRQEKAGPVALARELVRQGGCDRGYCLVLGADDADLATAIARVSRLRVELLTTDAEKVGRLRRALAEEGLHGGRICVRHQSSSRRLPYPPYVFNLVVDQAALSGGRPAITPSEAVRVTKPCGGVALVDVPAEQRREIERLGAVCREQEDVVRIERGKIPGSRDWTHNYATAANTYSSEDPHVKGPFGVLWYGDPGPRKRIERHATPPIPLLVNGRLFTTGYDLVMAYDAYNGICYWEREIPGATREGLPLGTSNLAAGTNSLFVVIDGRECLRLDARTGETLQRYPVSAREGAEINSWAWIALDRDRLYGSRAEYDPKRRRARRQTSETVFALDVGTGRSVWAYDGRGIDHDGIAIDGGRLFLVDRALAPEECENARNQIPRDASVPDREQVGRDGKAVAADLRALVALDAVTGRQLWRKPLDVTDITIDDTIVHHARVGVACMVKDGVVVVHGTGSLGHPHKEFLAGEFARRAMYAFDAANGTYLWGGRKGYRKRPIIVGDHVYAEPFAWHLRTGEQKMVTSPLSGKPQTFDIHRGYIGCSHLLASGTALFGNRNGIACYNLDDQAGFVPFDGVSLACGLCAVPANGIFVAPEGRSGCTCPTPIHTSLALYPKPVGGAWGDGVSGGCAEVAPLPVRHVSINLGAPGYRRDAERQLWIPYPARVDTGALGKWLPTYQHDRDMCYRLVELRQTITGTDLPWVFTSGYAHTKPLIFRLQEEGASPAKYSVRLYFAEPEDLAPGQRVFSVVLQGRTVIEELDVVRLAGGARRALVRHVRGVKVERDLRIELVPSAAAAVKTPILCGFQAFRE